ncbi:uncharacterized protein LOC125651204 [Ostrea edulis]|uniref:uncharacterized protein LOC125651204 n=1 Tax=Ostrea edulis TaxID=37623 RepID=UPI0020958D30|nr:uncharacterized protein LOC125651204 [Ostrea edulis]
METFFAGLLVVIFGVGNHIVGIYGQDHEIATSVCVGLAPDKTYTAAIPRRCWSGESCNDICRSVSNMDEVSDAFTPQPRCINALHIYPNNRGPKHTPNTKWINTWRYGSRGCEATHCGPNFCCCSQ